MTTSDHLVLSEPETNASVSTQSEEGRSSWYAPWTWFDGDSSDLSEVDLERGLRARADAEGAARAAQAARERAHVAASRAQSSAVRASDPTESQNVRRAALRSVLGEAEEANRAADFARDRAMAAARAAEVAEAAAVAGDEAANQAAQDAKKASLAANAAAQNAAESASLARVEADRAVSGLSEEEQSELRASLWVEPNAAEAQAGAQSGTSGSKTPLSDGQSLLRDSVAFQPDPRKPLGAVAATAMVAGVPPAGMEPSPQNAASTQPEPDRSDAGQVSGPQLDETSAARAEREADAESASSTEVPAVEAEPDNLDATDREPVSGAAAGNSTQEQEEAAQDLSVADVAQSRPSQEQEAASGIAEGTVDRAGDVASARADGVSVPDSESRNLADASDVSSSEEIVPDDEISAAVRAAEEARREAEQAVQEDTDARALATEARVKATQAAGAAKVAATRAASAEQRARAAQRLADVAEPAEKAQAEADAETAEAAAIEARAQAEEAEALAETAEDEATEAADAAAEAKQRARSLTRRASTLQSEAEALQALAEAKLPAASNPSLALRLEFPKGDAELSGEAESAIVSLAEQIREAKEAPVEIRAYWSAEEDEATRSKRLSLKRGMLVRTLLNHYGVHSTRIVLKRLVLDDEVPPLIDVMYGDR